MDYQKKWYDPCVDMGPSISQGMLQVEYGKDVDSIHLRVNSNHVSFVSESHTHCNSFSEDTHLPDKDDTPWNDAGITDTP